MSVRLITFLQGTCAVAMLAGCVNVAIEDRVYHPSIEQLDAHKLDTQVKSISNSRSITVLSYNVAGLPWPLSSSRKDSLYAIGDELATMHEQGIAPDIVLIQEGFSSHTAELIFRSRYPYYVQGSLRGDKVDESQSIVPEEFLRDRKFLKGERFGRIMGSGLFILSKWPIHRKVTEPFYKGACAGFDCGANKGSLWAEVSVPGMPGLLQIMTTHLNSRNSSGVSHERTLRAHNLQFTQLAQFVERNWRAEEPLIFGGDFNIKDADERFEYLTEYDDGIESSVVRENQFSLFACVSDPKCEMLVEAPTEDRLLISQDWQGFSVGNRVSIVPSRIEPLFHLPDHRVTSIKGRFTLSDHDGQLVTYELSW